LESTGIVLLSLLAVVLSGFVARLVRLPLPLVQIAMGALIAQSPLPAAALDPKVFFLLFLAPLLFIDGWRMPKDALRRDAPVVLTLALGLVLFTVLGMGWFMHLLIPAMPLAVCFALAAVVSPTDPIAVSAIAKRTPLPPRLMRYLQGESLLNDASGLVCMRFAVAAALTGQFSPTDALASFAWLALGGVAIGVVATLVVAGASSWALQRLGPDGGAQILITLLIPFGVYLLAEAAGCSGVLAAVTAGISMSYTDRWHWAADTRLSRTAVWDTVQLAANGSIFVLLGEQLPALLAAAPAITQTSLQRPAAWLLVLVGVMLLALALLRAFWVAASLGLRRMLARRSGAELALGGARTVAVMTLAGVRGAVTLAGVLTLPLTLGDGRPFPGRELAILLAAGVLVGSLVLAAVALPLALRGYSLPPEPTQSDAERAARIAAAHAAVAAVQAAQRALPDAASGRGADVAARIVALYELRIEHHDAADASADAGEDDEIEHRLRLAGLEAERAEVRRIRDAEGIDDLGLRKLVREIDHQEARFLR